MSRGADLERAGALWAVSDPLHLTSVNERRVQHYARLALADIAFTDPGRGVRGRDTQPGRLVLRYGWPKHIWEVVRDGTAELDPDNMRAAFLLWRNVPWSVALPTEVAGKASGRWTFFNYDLTMPNFVFERSLTERSYHYKLITMTEWVDTALARVAPSTFESPYAEGEITALLTRFPRPHQPLLEVGARFRWVATGPGADSVRVGVFVHELGAGRLVNRGVSARWARDSVRFAAALPVVWGGLQVAVEGTTAGPTVAAFARSDLAFAAGDDGLVLSDLLLGETLDAPDDADRREEVTIQLRVDSMPTPRAPLALYWEAYGLAADTAGVMRYAVTLRVDDVSGGRSPASASSSSK